MLTMRMCGKGDDLLDVNWNINMIMLGCTVSVLGAFTGLTTTTYAYTVLRHKQLRFYYNLYLALGGCSIGGSAIWTMHFVGMQAMLLSTPGHKHITHQFNLAMTLTSLVAACAIGTLCMHLVMPSGELSEGASTNRTAAAVALARASSYWKLPFTLFGKELYLGKFKPYRFAQATFTLATGVIIMHYMGMLAMYGEYWSEWNFGIVIGTYLLAFVVSAAGLFIVVQCAYVGTSWISLVVRAIAAIVIGAAVNSVHYAGIQATCYHETEGHDQNLMYGLGLNVSIDAQVVLIAAFAFSVLQLLLTHAHLAALAAQMASNATKIQPTNGV